MMIRSLPRLPIISDSRLYGFPLRRASRLSIFPGFLLLWRFTCLCLGLRRRVQRTPNRLVAHSGDLSFIRFFRFSHHGPPMPKPQQFCIFCGGARLSKEHLLSDWLKELFPRTPNDQHSLGESEGGPFKVTTGQGHSGSKKIRTVCRDCNSQWISEIDNAAKSTIVPLIQGASVTVDEAMQTTIATWLSKIATVGDSRNRAKSVITPAERTFIKDNTQPPRCWEVWIFSYDGVDRRDLSFFQDSGKLEITTVPPPGIKLSGYVETTFIGMGKLAALVIANNLPEIQLKASVLDSRARRIWPVSPSFDWPITPPLDDNDAAAVERILKRMKINIR